MHVQQLRITVGYANHRSWKPDSVALSDQGAQFEKAIPYLKDRLTTLENAPDKKVGGLVNDVFLKNPINNAVLKINRSFAFFDFEEYHGNEVKPISFSRFPL